LLEGEALACRVLCSQGSPRGIVHDQEGQAILDGKIEHAHDMGMLKPRKGLRFP